MQICTTCSETDGTASFYVQSCTKFLRRVPEQPILVRICTNIAYAISQDPILVHICTHFAVTAEIDSFMVQKCAKIAFGSRPVRPYVRAPRCSVCCSLSHSAWIASFFIR